MENLKLLRNAKLKSRQLELKKKIQQESTSSRLNSNLFDSNSNYLECLENNSSQEDFFSKLSDEIILKIFNFIPRKTLLKYAIVCKRWHQLMSDEFLWISFDLSYRINHAETVMKLLNLGVKMLALGHSDIRKSTKKYVTQNDENLRNLNAQFNKYLFNSLKIEFLDLTNALIDTDSLNSLLKHCKSLLKLSLESLEINNETFLSLSKNKRLETLNLTSCRGFTVEGVIILLESFKNLVSLNMAWTDLDRESVYIICKHLPSSIKKLSLAGCKTTLLDSDIQNLVISCPNIVDLDLSDAQSLTNLSIETISNGFRNLEYVAFSRCYSIIPSSYFMLAKLRNLFAIDLFNILKANSIQTLKNYIPTLRFVNRYPFCFIARPRIGNMRKSLWGYKISQNLSK
ncbi:unnamed protein product [Brachionus calyciflorus]|uniref:F-box domain-containing protein n=1 Tax=Brachionus calyciflorus TaxID=104777 RepID=A0A813ZTJ2_9BILA|nr:unnamed protein product [Brachionus calyciflorus]